MTGAAEALQKGVYNALGGNAGLGVAGLAGSPVQLYDEPTPNAAFPFITIGNDDPIAWGARDIDGFSGEFKVEIWSQGERGRSTVKTIADQIYAALHKNTFPVTGFTIVVCRFAAMTSDTADGINWHAESKFSFIMQAN
jgi:Protein of unknown function (DUF3168)